ncbi:hypothetical protein PIB30_001770 [Stylosanthes scabra]|uniref:Uncharacterized protein n=1 Tax=Stylosanthes scabra TaxID=79078 RepID=A0ABU6V523_9FABA|nr:hypothetical protein [Stylosanthes scabra]
MVFVAVCREWVGGCEGQSDHRIRYADGLFKSAIRSPNTSDRIRSAIFGLDADIHRRYADLIRSMFSPKHAHHALENFVRKGGVDVCEDVQGMELRRDLH